MNIIETWYLIKHLNLPIDCDCKNIIVKMYEDNKLLNHRIIYHNHIYKWIDDKPNSIKSNLKRNELLLEWYGIVAFLINQEKDLMTQMVGLPSCVYNIDDIASKFNYNKINEYKIMKIYKYNRMYKEKLI